MILYNNIIILGLKCQIQWSLKTCHNTPEYLVYTFIHTRIALIYIVL